MRPTTLLVTAFLVACSGKSTEGMNPGECINGIDDDENGLFDCDDPGCLNAPDCADTGTVHEGGEDTDTGMSGSGDGSSGDGSGGDGASGDGTGSDGSGDDGTGDDGTGDDGSGGDGSDGGATGDDGGAPDGASLYATYCASCHGASGEGAASGPPLESEVNRHTDEELIAVIQEGDGSMPAIDVTDEEAQAIVDFMRTLFGG